ncbi:hypothetical protein [Streptomyces sp. V3I7]|nr:hypothetical protein [Streptomyces sp. V3I7]MDQ0994410.1 hypothetical protein [Streptomyces sp. V3I7]
MRWEHSDRARSELARHVASGNREVPLFELILEIFRERGISVVLR